ncbi:MAG: hypothetical protein LBS91_01505 [Clostridiales Family XIII bacterium]|jgi:hypothetical protein|nr:hypothetical protein [Clostridiales Family XIII bacterium]
MMTEGRIKDKLAMKAPGSPTPFPGSPQRAEDTGRNQDKDDIDTCEKRKSKSRKT